MKHTHRYERRQLGSKNKHDIYKCATRGCGHYMVDVEAVIGRNSLCWGIEGPGSCDNLVEMTRYMVMSEKRKWPLCEKCKEKKKDLKESIQDELKEGTDDASINA